MVRTDQANEVLIKVGFLGVLSKLANSEAVGTSWLCHKELTRVASLPRWVSRVFTCLA